MPVPVCESLVLGRQGSCGGGGHPPLRDRSARHASARAPTWMTRLRSMSSDIERWHGPRCGEVCEGSGRCEEEAAWMTRGVEHEGGRRSRMAIKGAEKGKG
eukprot:1224443-Rhodomonas_salina.1